MRLETSEWGELGTFCRKVLGSKLDDNQFLSRPTDTQRLAKAHSVWQSRLLIEINSQPIGKISLNVLQTYCDERCTIL